MKELPKKYDHREAEKRWQRHWVEHGTYHWQNDAAREDTYVIDTPPPTVSGHLHMGHVFSYVQADIIARYQRMKGKDVFYPMGFDDNGLPTERLVEKTKKKRATDYDSREDFIKVCEEVSEAARKDFRELFQTLALSVDWRQEYHTISDDCRRLSQQSFLDLYEKGHIERRLEPMLWDPVDQTAIAQAEIEDKELDSHFSDIRFTVIPNDASASEESQKIPRRPDGLTRDDEIIISTTRPELIPACVGIFYHPDDDRYRHLKGKQAVTPLFGIKVPILEDDTVEPEKGSGIMMCCTFGDEADIEKWRKHGLQTRIVINQYGKMDLSELSSRASAKRDERSPEIPPASDDADRNDAIEKLQNKKVSNPDQNHPGARQIILKLLADSGDLIESRPIRHAVKCAERSGAPLEILPTYQWFVKVTDKKKALKARARESHWYPDWMRLRMEQWIDGLNWDWCISRQRYYGVPFPVWYLIEIVDEQAYLGKTQENSHIFGKSFSAEPRCIVAKPEWLPVNPLDRDKSSECFESIGYKVLGLDAVNASFRQNESDVIDLIVEKDGKKFALLPDADVMDTWATSSISPQINARAIHPPLNLPPQGGEAAQAAEGGDRFAKLFPADLRPQAHEIIRTWAFYTVVKSHLHNNSIPWKNLMISGWCLAEDKTKMSKSKGNVVTPVELIEQQGTDAVRYWAATSRLGQDTAYSPDLLKIGKKLVTKLWNATKFAAIHLEKLPHGDLPAATETLDQWILSRLHQAVKKSTESFEKYEYADALRATEDFFWNDFCDNYLELVKRRAYGNEEADRMSASALSPSHGEAKEGRAGDKQKQLSATVTIYHCLDGILKLFAPFVPHITEELYSHIFHQAYDSVGSLHSRNQWPNSEAYPYDKEAEKYGIAAVEILEAIRKAKSEKGVSIKYPITQLVISHPPLNLPPEGGEAAQAAEGDEPSLTASLLSDLAGAGNIENLFLSDKEPAGSATTESGRFALTITFAALPAGEAMQFPSR